jgi:hypothetical protein
MAQTFDTFAQLMTALRSWPEDSLPTVLLTPALAAEILASDPVNRKIRMGNLERLKREITAGLWNVQKSSAMRFLDTNQLADGQHRCRAVIATETPIVVPMAIVTDTLGVDEGAPRTVGDHLGLRGVAAEDTGVASQVTHTLCKIFNAGIRDYVDYFEANREFIMECVTKPKAWLAEQDRVIGVIVKPALLASIRAQAIMLYHEPADAVDEVLYDIVNMGATAPEGSPRRQVAQQIFEQLRLAHEKKGAKARDVMSWVRNALACARQGKVRNVITAKLLTAKKSGRPRKPPATVAA